MQKIDFTKDPGTPTEDCLYLNVFTKDIKSAKSVLVWIHGGGFTFGSATVYGQEFFIHEDIVLVVIQYRLNVFGFLGFDDETIGISGNFGFKDQILALKWVQENINAFGGDPNQVTIFGESAGAASTGLLMLSPAAKGLFKGVITESGSATNTWLWGDVENTYNYALLLNCTQGPTLASCLRSKSAEELLKAFQVSQKWVRYLGDIFSFPVVTIEKDIPEEQPFLTQTPLQILKDGTFNKVPLLTGFLTHEAYGMATVVSCPMNCTDNELLLPRDLNLSKGTQESKEAGELLKKFYWGDSQPSKEVFGDVNQIATEGVSQAEDNT